MFAIHVLRQKRDGLLAFPEENVCKCCICCLLLLVNHVLCDYYKNERVKISESKIIQYIQK